MRSGLAALICSALMASSVAAQQAPQPAPAQRAPTPDPKDEIVVRKNAWTIGLISGHLEDLYARFAAEMQQVLDDGDELRVMPILANGAAANVEDLLYTKGVDVAFTQSDVLAHFKTARKLPNLADRLHYIAALDSMEVHILARPEIKTIRELAGKTVSLGSPGSSASLTGPIVFDRLKIKVDFVNLDDALGLEKLTSGDIDAVVRVIGKPAADGFKVPAESGLHFVPIPYDEGSKTVFDDLYSLGELTHEDYPDIIADGEVIDTLAVTTVLAVYNWPRTAERYRRVERFTRSLFNRFDRFNSPSFHPKWKEVNLAASVPGWTRFSVADQILKQTKPATAPRADQGEVRSQFSTFLQSRGIPPGSEEDNDALFKEFVSWRERSSAR